MWFEKLTGFREISPEHVRENIRVEGTQMRSLVNGRVCTCGRLEIASLERLRRRVALHKKPQDMTHVEEVVADVQALHIDEANAHALFQVASQFNLLEMTSPSIAPEDGIDRYEEDHTQGPACAIAAGAGTIYRNYFVDVDGQIGQSAKKQIDCLHDLGEALGNDRNRLWTMKNGYALASEKGLTEISRTLRQASPDEIDRLRGLLRIGIQWESEVTLGMAHHTVSQAYCAALPVAYSRHASVLWEDFARLILEASYEATFCAAILNAAQNGNHTLYLTLLGGGVFGNDTVWIIDAMERALVKFRDFALDVKIVSYGSSRPEVRELIERYYSYQ